ncbi:hypothetical protein MKW94_002785 [Papaver nudicaule]|uniref:F-box domain-containing protein n=1 Tax=Papaver nudicaule TaxID=74823 RepID=A0AA42B1T2_PAPNU|nr:hypothetical protein [Papaver nudicaule]
MEIVSREKTKKRMAEQLPMDLETEILCRLPIKNLTVFKCVSKSWNRLISHVCIPRITADVCILNLYRLHRKIVPELCDACCLSDKMPELNYRGSIPKDRDNKACYREIDCCNGLSLYMDEDICRYILVSRSTNQYFDIPEPLEGVKETFTALAFDPVQSNDYKIVLPLHHLDSPCLDIFSSDIGKWVRHIVPGDWVKHLLVVDYDITYYKEIKWARKTVYLDGMLYMLTLEKHLVLFDLKSLVVSAQVIKVPCQTGICRAGVIGQIRSVLYYVNYNEEYKLSVWQFDYHNASGSFWILKHCISVDDMLSENQAILHTMKLNHQARPCRLFEPYGIHPLLDIIYIALQGRVYSYHLESHKCELVWQIDRCLDWREAFVYAFSYSYVNVKDFRMEDHATKSTRDVKLENVSD